MLMRSALNSGVAESVLNDPAVFDAMKMYREVWVE